MSKERHNDRNSRTLNLVVNVALAVVSVAFVYTVAKDYLPWGGGKPDIIEAGSELKLKDVDWGRQPETLVLVLSTTCHYCTESAPFYRRLTAALEQRPDVRVLAVFPQSVEEGRRYLASMAVPIKEVRQEEIKSIRVPLTPSLLTVNGAGRVVDIWTGRLDLKQEQAVFSGLKLKDKYQLATEETGVTRVDFAELKRALAEKRPLLILDVEERDVFAAGHIPGAVNIPADELEARIGEELSQTDTIVVYSDSADLSQRATEIIGAEGFMRVSMLDGGYSQWEKFNREAR